MTCINIVLLLLLLTEGQGEYFHIRMSGGLDLTSNLQAKFGARSSQVSPNKRKNLGRSVTTRRKSNPNFGVKSETQSAKFGVFVTYIFEAKFGAPTRISVTNFGAKRPRPPNMEVPPGTEGLRNVGS